MWEEIGFDITKLISENNFIEYNKNNKRKKMYIVLGIEEHTTFKTFTRNEIGRIEYSI